MIFISVVSFLVGVVAGFSVSLYLNKGDMEKSLEMRKESLRMLDEAIEIVDETFKEDDRDDNKLS